MFLQILSGFVINTIVATTRPFLFTLNQHKTFDSSFLIFIESMLGDRGLWLSERCGGDARGFLVSQQGPKEDPVLASLRCLRTQM